MIQPKEEKQSEGLTAREIFKRIIKGEVVKLPSNDSVLAAQLKNHLNVIKSREKKLFTSLGLDFISAVIQCVPKWTDEQVMAHPKAVLITDIPVSYYEFSLIAPKQRRRYPAFVITQAPDKEILDETTINVTSTG